MQENEFSHSFCLNFSFQQKIEQTKLDKCIVKHWQYEKNNIILN